MDNVLADVVGPASEPAQAGDGAEEREGENKKSKAEKKSRKKSETNMQSGEGKNDTKLRNRRVPAVSWCSAVYVSTKLGKVKEK